MPIANYTTEVAPEKSIAEIHRMLVSHGASHILTDYNDGKPAGIAFIITTPYGDRPFRLPANIGSIVAVLVKQLESSTYRQWDTAYQEKRRAKTTEQAHRVGWRILRDWVRAQMAILETEMVTIDQIFLPYMEVGNKTLYEHMVDHQLQLRGPDDQH